MPSQQAADPRRRLPSVDRLLASAEMQRLVGLYGRALVTVQARAALAALREEAAADGEVGAEAVAALPERVRAARRVEPRPAAAAGAQRHRHPAAHQPRPRAAAARRWPRRCRRCSTPPATSSSTSTTGRRGDRNRRAERLLRAAHRRRGGAGGQQQRRGAGAGARQRLGGDEPARSWSRAASWSRSAARSASRRSSPPPARGWSRWAPPTARGSPTTPRRSVRRRALLLKVIPSNYRIVGFVAGGRGRARSPTSAASAGLPLLVDEGSGLLRPRARAAARATTRASPSCSRPAPTSSAAAATSCSADRRRACCSARRELVGRCRAASALPRAAPRAGSPTRRSRRCCAGTWPARRCRSTRCGRSPSAHRDAAWRAVAAARRRRGRRRRRLRRRRRRARGADPGRGGGAARRRRAAARGCARGEPPVVGYLRDGRLMLDLRTVEPADDRR